MNTHDHEKPSSSLESAIGDVVATARDQGQMWARHGLAIGRAALETNARALRSVADLLGKLADGLTPTHEEPKPEAKPDA
jgi:hypothetical protein